MSLLFIDAITARFPAVADRVAADWPRLAASDRSPDWRGWRTTDEVAARYGITNVNLVKPGVGETTRVLLRRVPWRVLVRPNSESDLRHVLLLAEQRGVPVEEVPGLPYSCVGLIRPGFTTAPAEAGALSPALGPASSGLRSVGNEVTGATREDGATEAPGPAPAEAGALSRAVQ
jgi:hypothetical protein